MVRRSLSLCDRSPVPAAACILPLFLVGLIAIGCGPGPVSDTPTPLAALTPTLQAGNTATPVTPTPAAPQVTPTPTSAPATPSPSPTATLQPSPTRTAAPPTPSPTATPQPSPTRTPLPPTSTPSPTATPQPSPTPTPTLTPTAIAIDQLPAVLIGEVVFAAELAMTPGDRALGLSGRESLAPRTGMLFIFETGVTSFFWMKGMLFPLDFVWVSVDCRVVDITRNVPAPEPDATNLPLYSSTETAAYNFEINGGEADAYGLAVGDAVRFFGVPTESGAVCE